MSEPENDALESEDTLAGEPDEIELTMVDPALADADPRDRIDGVAGGEAPKYERVRQLGTGAMGAVVEIKDAVLRRRAALKEVLPKMAKHPQMLMRFISEAQITAQLDHPNIVPIYDFERREDGSLAYSMKMVRGRELKEMLDAVRQCIADGKPVDEQHQLEARLEVFIKLCDAVAFAHARGVVHRDLKPANVMIGDYGEVYLMDWGIARRMGARTDDQLDEQVELGSLDGEETNPELTQAGQAIGTPRYMSPEQAQGRNSELDGRSDQFSLGLILFEVVSLRRAVEGKTTIDALTAVLSARKAPLVHIDDKTRIPRELRAIVDKATARDPMSRYDSVEALADDVRRYLAGKAVHAQPDNAVQGVLRWVRHHAATAAVLTMLVLLVFAGLTLWSVDGKRKAIADAKQREEKLTAFQTRVAAQSHAIDSWLVRYEERANALALGAAARLGNMEPHAGAIYDHVAFRDKATGPKDLARSEIYGKEISVTTPVYKVAPGVDPATVVPLARKLWPLWRPMRQLFVDCRTRKEIRPSSAEDVSHLLHTTGTPLRWSYIGLEEGLMFSFPGKTYDDDYDPRKRPWYVNHKDATRPGWGSPHVDSHTKKLTLTCTAPVIDASGKHRGVCGLDVTFDYLIEELMKVTGLPGLRETYLLDEEGRVLIRSTDKGKQLNKIEPRPFESDVVAARVKLAASGVHIAGGQVFAFYHMPSIHWTFVVRAELKAVLAGVPE